MKILEVKNLKKHFGGIKAVDGCSFEVNKGDLVGLIGPNGSGKTTTFNLLTGLEIADEGKIIFNGKDIIKLDTYKRAEFGMSRTFQLIKTFPELTTLDNIMLARKCKHAENFWNQLFSMNKVKKEEEENKKVCLRILEKVDLLNKKDFLAKELSYGQQKLLGIAKVIASDSQLLLFDEPFAGVNPSLAKKILEIIKHLNKQGKTIIIVEHNMNIIMKLCKKIIVLDAGKEIAVGSPKQIQKNKKVVEAYLG